MDIYFWKNPNRAFSIQGYFCRYFANNVVVNSFRRSNQMSQYNRIAILEYRNKLIIQWFLKDKANGR